MRDTYYQNQLKRLSTKDGVTVQFWDEHKNKTNCMRINAESVGAISDFLNELLKSEMTHVVFRVFKPQHAINGAKDEVIALFPNDPYNNDGLCMSYQKVGQHGGADYTGMMQQTRKAKPSEYASLKKELEGMGYILQVRTKRCRK